MARALFLASLVATIAGACAYPTGAYRFPRDGATAGDGASDASCADTASDPRNCGACGVSCGAGRCVMGACTCDASLTRVGAAPAFDCADLQLDPTNCGAPGVLCRDDQACQGGSCVCRAGLTDVGGGTCSDTRTDPTNCGMLGVACPTAASVCVNGVCSARTLCLAPRVECRVGTRGACVSLATDPRNCGACDAVCARDEVCVMGHCQRYRPAVGCTSCPCTEVCTALFAPYACCRNPLGSAADPNLCVQGSMCP